MESLEQKYAQTLENSNLSLKQRQVLLSSLKLFSEIGFENTTASLIAKEAGVSEGTVFSYFKTKEGILEAILSTFLEQVFIQKNQMQVKILLSRSFIDKTISDQLGNVIIHSIIKPISSVLNQFKEKGVIRDWSNERIVRYILALSLSYIIPMMLNDKEDVDIDETVNEIVECLSFALVEVK
ncbi:TetR/AcrR family transcriptional regulator [Streptococcus oralis]|uniref:TetR/AcrR family transcriptional regulator n=1 Tax=Streptococcus oralis TaxID=1303 RepID=UPI00190CBF26|nr:TetR/AcrR family transcriptional regulator [Streptococcus oralis]MBK3298315.1 helix-turn-helix transcriptional regulator [Streptococcus oralis]